MTYKAGLIGTGGIGKRHANTYQDNPQLDLIAIADLDSEQLESFGSAFDISPRRRYLDHREMLNNVDLDIVSISTPTHLHAKHVLDVAGSDAEIDVIWCEKPIATNVNDARQMVSVCDDENIELVINHTMRFLDEVVELRRLIQEDNLLGEIHTINVQWMRELLRLGTHAVDLLIYIFGERGSEVMGGYLTGEIGVATKAEKAEEHIDEIDDAGGAGMFRLTDETLVMLECTSPRATPREVIDILGSNGRLMLDYPNEELRFWRFEGSDYHETDIPSVSWERLEEKNFKNVGHHVVDLLNGDAENRSPGRDAIKSLEILLGIFIASYTNGQVQLPLEDPLRSVNVSSW